MVFHNLANSVENLIAYTTLKRVSHNLSTGFSTGGVENFNALST